jgi:predicted peptidase
VYLHGSGGLGTNNLNQIAGGNTNGTHLWTRPEMQTRHPAFVVAPQLPPGNRWDAPGASMASYALLLIELLAGLREEFPIDSNRLYLVGQSLGGFGTWDLIIKSPPLFAAAVPLCGGGDPTRASVISNLPIWAFHGGKDQTVSANESTVMVAALRALGSGVKYTEYPEIGHDVWTVAFTDADLPEWLFAQRRRVR